MKFIKLNYLLVIILFSACEHGQSSHSERDIQAMEIVDEFVAMEEATPVTNSPVPTPPSLEIKQKLIKSGRIEFESKDALKNYKKLVSTLPHQGAYIENENQSRTDYRITYNITLRVPAVNYDSLYTKITALSSSIENKSSNVEDVTERYYDLKTRIKNKQALEERYKNILSKASKVKELLEIEKELNEVRIDIERMQGQFNYLSKQINYSTIYVNFYETLPYTYNDSKRAGYGARILTALNDGWQSFLIFSVKIISFWPYLLILVTAFLIIRKRPFKLKFKSSKK